MEDVNQLLGNIKPIQWRGKPIILSDGAMATFLHQSGVSIRSCSEAFNITHPHRVEEVHKAYVEAGANVIQTNTFSAHRSGLARFDLEGEVGKINRAAAQIALRAAAGKAAVYGTIGSILGVHTYGTPLDAEQRNQLESEVTEQAQALLAEPIHGILLETYPELEEMLFAIQTVRKLTDLPILANLAPDDQSVTRDGVPLYQALLEMIGAGASVVGLNCKLGPNGILRAYENMPLDPSIQYAAIPNAGLLHRVDNDIAYTGSEDYFAHITERLLQVGVSWVGGCCGTTPAHIQRARERIEKGDVSISNSRSHSVQVPVHKSSIEIREVVNIAAGQEKAQKTEASDSLIIHNDLQPQDLTVVDKVKKGITVIVELDPPKTLDCMPFLKGADALARAGADYITLADNSLATVRVSNLAMATLLKLHNIEPLVHIACRDRNLIGQQSHLMGLDVLGIRNILLITGDPSKFGDLPGATSVYDVSSIDLTKMVKRLNDGIGFSGRALERPARFVIGTSFNPQLLNLSKGIGRLQRKVEAGAEFVMTQPVYDVRLMEKLKRASEEVGVPIFIGIMPLVSARNALFLHHEVPGIVIPEEIMNRIQNADEAIAAQEGIRIAETLIDDALSMFNGIYLITPFLRYKMTEHLTKYIKSKQTVLAKAD